MESATGIKRVLTGMRTTGQLHLGHYVGALKLWLKAQEEKDIDCFFLLADVQALTTHADQPELIRQSVRDVVLDWIAVGLDPARSNVHFVLQSQVPARFQISQYLLMIATLGEIQRNPTVKAEMKGMKSPTIGFMSYVVDQAADILMVSPVRKPGNALLVPVGADQAPHLEYSRELARRFNRMYKTDVFLPCQAEIGEIGTLMGTDGSDKMSKSKGNAIYLADPADEVTRKVMGMYTDPNRKRATDPGTVEGNVVFEYLDAFAPDDGEVDEYKVRYQAGKIGDVELKRRLAQILNEFLDPIRERRLLAEKEPIGEYVRVGTQRASEIADGVLRGVESAMFLGYP